EVEERHASLLVDPIDLGEERPGPGPPGMRHVLEERAFADEPLELLVREEPVLAAVPLLRPPLARRRGDGELELRHACEESLLDGSLAGPGRAGDDYDRPASFRREAGSSVS